MHTSPTVPTGTVFPLGSTSLALTCGCTLPTVSVRCWRVSSGEVWNAIGLSHVRFSLSRLMVAFSNVPCLSCKCIIRNELGLDEENEHTHAICNRQLSQVKFGDELVHQFDRYWGSASYTGSVGNVSGAMVESHLNDGTVGC